MRTYTLPDLSPSHFFKYVYGPVLNLFRETDRHDFPGLSVNSIRRVYFNSSTQSGPYTESNGHLQALLNTTTDERHTALAELATVRGREILLNRVLKDALKLQKSKRAEIFNFIPSLMPSAANVKRVLPAVLLLACH